MTNGRLPNIRQAVKNHKAKQSLANAVGCHVQTLYQIASGKSLDPGTELIETICRMLKLDPRTGFPLKLATVEREEQRSLIVDFSTGRSYGKDATVEMVGIVSAGNGTQPTESVYVDGDGGKPLPVPRALYKDALRHPRREVKAVTLSGDSMEPEYHSGDVLVLEMVHEWDDLRDRDHVVWDLGTGNYVFRIWAEGIRALEPINRDHFDAMFPTADTRGYGRVVMLIRTRK